MTTQQGHLRPARAATRELFRVTDVTVDYGSATATATALATGPALDFVRAVVPGAEVDGANPAAVRFGHASLVRLHRIASGVGEDDFRAEASVPIRAALDDVLSLLDVGEPPVTGSLRQATVGLPATVPGRVA
jgi:hypothetical protein